MTVLLAYTWENNGSGNGGGTYGSVGDSMVVGEDS